MFATSVIEAMQMTAAAEMDIAKEYDDHDAYKKRFLLTKYKFDSRIATKSTVPPPNLPSEATDSVKSDQGELRRTFNLPKLKLVKFRKFRSMRMPPG